MRKFLILITLLVSAIAAYAQDSKNTLDSLGWISGLWEMSSNGRVTTERWGKATENLMLGTSQTVKGTKTVSFEFLRIASTADGLAYVAKPSTSKDETVFSMLRAGDKEVVFENLKHDFPQRIIYKQTKSDALAARIEGTMNGQIKGMDFPMTRVKCD